MMLLDSDSTRSLMPPGSRLLRLALRVIHGYGYRPGRVLRELRDLRRGECVALYRNWGRILTEYGLPAELLPDISRCDACDGCYWSVFVADDGYCDGCHDRAWHCGTCGDIQFTDASYAEILNGEAICGECRRDYHYCEECGDLFHLDDLTPIGGTFYCENCPHPCDNNCEASERHFTFPAFGLPDDRLPCDTVVTVNLGAGEISQAALTALVRDLRVNSALSLDLSELAEAVGLKWQTSSGNWTKRFASHLLNRYSLKLSDKLMAEIGNRIRQDATQTSEVYLDVTRQFNQSAQHFAHGSSCYWGGYSESRCMLKQNNAIGLRFWDTASQSGRLPIARCWVQPAKWINSVLEPISDAHSADVFVCWNIYSGDLPQLALPRAIAALTGWSYRQTFCEFTEPMYINDGSKAVLVGPADLLAEIAAVDPLQLNLAAAECRS